MGEVERVPQQSSFLTSKYVAVCRCSKKNSRTMDPPRYTTLPLPGRVIPHLSDETTLRGSVVSMIMMVSVPCSRDENSFRVAQRWSIHWECRSSLEYKLVSGSSPRHVFEVPELDPYNSAPQQTWIRNIFFPTFVARSSTDLF